MVNLWYHRYHWAQNSGDLCDKVGSARGQALTTLFFSIKRLFGAQMGDGHTVTAFIFFTGFKTGDMR